MPRALWGSRGEGAFSNERGTSVGKAPVVGSGVSLELCLDAFVRDVSSKDQERARDNSVSGPASAGTLCLVPVPTESSNNARLNEFSALLVDTCIKSKDEINGHC